MLIIGLTGSLGSGKSTVAAMFKDGGAKVIDADAVTRELLTKNRNIIKKVAKLFPDAILSPGKINRFELAKIVFKYPRELKKLTDILYPEALNKVRRQISKYKRVPFVLLDVPLLFEAGWDKITDVNIVVTAKRQQQLARAQERLGVSKADALRRLKCQMPIKEKRALADMIIDNSQSLDQTRQQVNAITHRLKKKKSK